MPIRATMNLWIKLTPFSSYKPGTDGQTDRKTKGNAYYSLTGWGLAQPGRVLSCRTGPRFSHVFGFLQC